MVSRASKSDHPEITVRVKYHYLPPRNLAQLVVLLTCIWEVPNLILGQGTEYPDGFVIVLRPYSLVMANAFKQVTTPSSLILSISPYIIIRC